MQGDADKFYMSEALLLAARSKGRTSPNPMVGCVIAREGRIVGRGFHVVAGQPHAEVLALEDAGEGAKGGDLYVTLEPCAHHGRTPPCAELVARSGVRRVVAAMIDPNPLVAGKGIDLLRSADIQVDVGIMENEARRLNEAFCLSIREKRPFVHLKLAATLDGKTAAANGDSKWITSEESRQKVHGLRDACGAILVGAGTVAADNPALTVRLRGKAERRILRVILDPNLRSPLEATILQSPEEAIFSLLVCSEEISDHAAAKYKKTGAEILKLPVGPNGLELMALLKYLYGRGINEILVEGGGETARKFLDADLVDRFHLFQAPKILGGSDAKPLVGGKSPQRMADALELKDLEVEFLRPDIYVAGVPARR